MSEDIRATIGGMEALGAAFREDGGALTALGSAKPGVGGGRVVDCNESGSTLRFLIPLAALSGGETLFLGRGRLMERPLGVYAEAFAGKGVEFSQDLRGVRVKGPFRGGECLVAGDVSSQFVSGLLLALPLTEKGGTVRLRGELESRQYVDMTIDVMRAFGAKVEETPTEYRVEGGQGYAPAEYGVEGDFSQAAFFLGAAALGRDTRCLGLNRESRQGDRAILEILGNMGAETVWREDGSVTVATRGGRLKGITMDARENPDLAPPVAALCALAEGESRIVNAGRLRLKESDRLSAMAENLARLGARVREGADALFIEGTPSLRGGFADAKGDHRIAMAMALAAIRCEGPLLLRGWESVGKSYPNFWRDFEGE
jgi:3-phosphoshikimate 1-carboxyvinyltransferase